MLTQTPTGSLISVVAASILGALGQFLFQHAAKHGKVGILGFITNPYVLTGMIGYIAVMVLFNHAFRLGGTVRVLYPVYATTFIWAALIAWRVHHQPIQRVHILGMTLLVLGILCMSW